MCTFSIPETYIAEHQSSDKSEAERIVKALNSARDLQDLDDDKVCKIYVNTEEEFDTDLLQATLKQRGSKWNESNVEYFPKIGGGYLCIITRCATS